MSEGLQVGRELDRLIAVEVFDWKCTDRHCDGTRHVICGSCGRHGHGNCYGPRRGGEIQIECDHWPAYSTDIADAWKVVEHLKNTGYSVGIDTVREGWRCIIQGAEPFMSSTLNNRVEARAETAPLAICLAALKAAAVEVAE